MKSTKKIFRPRSPRNVSLLSRSVTPPVSLRIALGGSFLAVLASIASVISLTQQSTFAQAKPSQDYLVYVLSEAADKISLVRFGPNGARVDHDLVTGSMPADIDGPHGIAISRDQQFYYVSLAHGRPFGSVWKYSTKDDSVLGQVTLSLFPATMDLSADGSLLYVSSSSLDSRSVTRMTIPGMAPRRSLRRSMWPRAR